MDPNLKLATMLIIVALGTVGTTTATTAFADTDDEEEDDDSAIETADEAVHAIFGLGTEGDVLFHQGLCAGGISTEALDEVGGCEALPPIVGDAEEDDEEDDD